MTILTQTEATHESLDHLIDLDANPFIPLGWKVNEHRKNGQFKWDPSKVKLYLSKEQQVRGWPEGNLLRRELVGKPVYNANVLDYLLKNPHVIPEEWKGKSIFFWGTSTSNRMASCVCVTSAGSATGGTGTTGGSASTGATTTPPRCPRVEL